MGIKTARLDHGAHGERALDADSPMFVSGVRQRAFADPPGDDDRLPARDSVDRYLDDLDGTARITSGEETALAECLYDAAAKCLTIARDAGIRLEAEECDSERDTVIRGVTRLWRLLDEHLDAESDQRRTGMVRVVEEELGADGAALQKLRRLMAPARERARVAREALTEANLALVVYVAKSYRQRGVPMADLIQEGNISLLHAVEKFDPVHETRLATYATAWLHRSMRRTLRSQSRTVRLPESARNAESRSVPIDEPLGGERLSLTDVLCENDATAPDDEAAREELRDRARDILGRLPKQEAFVVRRRFGIDGGEPMTLREIGDELGITRERVRQIEKSALDKLRRRLRSFDGR